MESLPSDCEDIHETTICPATSVNVQQYLCRYEEIDGDNSFLAITAAIDGVAICGLLIFIVVGFIFLSKMKKDGEYKLLE